MVSVKPIVRCFIFFPPLTFLIIAGLLVSVDFVGDFFFASLLNSNSLFHLLLNSPTLV